LVFSLTGCNFGQTPTPTVTVPPPDTTTPIPPTATPAKAAVVATVDPALLQPPVLREPADGVVFTDLESTALLDMQWDALKPKLGNNEYYLVTVRYMSRGEAAVDYILTQETRSSLALVQDLLNQSDDFLFFWTVTLFRLDHVDEQGVPQGAPLSVESPKRALVWSVSGIVPATPLPGAVTATLTPPPPTSTPAPGAPVPAAPATQTPTASPAPGDNNTGIPVIQPTVTPTPTDDNRNDDPNSSDGNNDGGGDIGYP
jgi:hypothetical protein